MAQHVNEMLEQVLHLWPAYMAALVGDAWKMKQLHPHAQEQTFHSCFLHLHVGSVGASVRRWQVQHWHRVHQLHDLYALAFQDAWKLPEHALLQLFVSEPHHHVVWHQTPY